MLNCYYAYSVLYLDSTFCFTHIDLQYGRVYLVTIDREFNDVTARHLYKPFRMWVEAGLQLLRQGGIYHFSCSLKTAIFVL